MQIPLCNDKKAHTTVHLYICLSQQQQQNKTFFYFFFAKKNKKNIYGKTIKNISDVFCVWQQIYDHYIALYCFICFFTGGNNVNEPPILESGGYPSGLPLSESTKVGSAVYTLRGHDPEGSPVKYGIQLTDKFTVDPETGVITLAKPLDREVRLMILKYVYTQ